MGIIDNIVGRCHISMTEEDVIDYVISRLADGQATFDAMTANQQKSFKMAILKAHVANINLYQRVTSGRL